MGRRLLSATQVAASLGCKPNSVWKRMAADPSFPRSIKLGPKTTRWDADALDRWIAEKEAAA